MKLKIKKSGSKVNDRDRKKSVAITRTLHRFSVKKRRQELVQSGEKPLKRTDAPVARPSDSASTTITLNASGNRRGMHNAENPPEAERMQKIRAMRKFYHKQMPVLACNNCSFAQSCPQFKAGFECAFLPFINAHKIESEEDLVDSMRNLIEANLHRAHLATALETLSGGAPSTELTESMAMLFNMTRDLHGIMSDAGNASLTIETDDTSIIGRLFGGINTLLGKTREAIEVPIEVMEMKTSEGRTVHALTDGHSVKENMATEILNDLAKTELEKAGAKVNTPAIQVS